MNEIIQQRIEFVQAGKDITYAQLIAKRNLREELETEMEKYLARGGRVETLKGTEFVPRPPRKQTKIKGHASKSQVVKIRNWVNAVSTTPTRREQLSRTTGIHINRVRSLLAPPATHGARMTQSEFSLFMEAIPFIERREVQGKAA
ncbi:hypothetical protein [Acinetobacter sp. CS-2]|uniref:hypothetical protein n=1 Tax=Acinetobacter sp. CS-2 TaxID=2798861 RepID=UPI001906BBFE|nr:hypothetical protein [Acinetobacter sp. CS-2]QQN40310.1 hypothetical protein JFY49_05140 [Acinetobacter sp. CS-2]